MALDDQAGEEPVSPLERVQRQATSDATVAWLRIEFVKVEIDRVLARMQVRDEMRNAFGIVHGGLLFLLGDTAFAFSGAAAGHPMVTHHASTTYTAPAKGSVITAEAKIVHRYGRNVICSAIVRDQDGTVVVHQTMQGVISRKGA